MLSLSLLSLSAALKHEAANTLIPKQDLVRWAHAESAHATVAAHDVHLGIPLLESKHVSAADVYSSTRAPGTKPDAEEAKKMLVRRATMRHSPVPLARSERRTFAARCVAA